MFFPRGFLIAHDSRFVLSQRVSHDTVFVFCSFPEIFSRHRIHVMFFPRDFLKTQDSCFVLSQRFSQDTGFVFCSFPESFP